MTSFVNLAVFTINNKQFKNMDTFVKIFYCYFYMYPKSNYYNTTSLVHSVKEARPRKIVLGRYQLFWEYMSINENIIIYLDK